MSHTVLGGGGGIKHTKQLQTEAHHWDEWKQTANKSRIREETAWITSAPCKL